MVTLRVCSFNLRVATPVDGINEYCHRRERILETIARHTPDLIGFQEASEAMREDLRTSLPAYTILGCGRKTDYRGESPILAFRSDRFELIEFQSFWLSPTPSVPGSRYEEDQSKCPRVTFMALLKHHEAETVFRFYNTHYDHVGSRCRCLSTEQMLREIGARPEPFVLTGDFNATPDTPEIRELVNCRTRAIVDATAALGPTFHAFGALVPEEQIKIDYIFTDLPCDTARSYAVTDGPVDGVYISDHFPVFAETTLA